ncbi:DNA-3-methyladenine glycosidase [Rhizobium sp. Leaf384]|uniref:DNA-3-methyladenine glycosylase family protein n=1 Tax=unclassified Rhizobium TaxID=2613769 RepID=UPI000713AA9D|nr:MULTISPECIES: DNA-3-methyladenine glycosylase [unclassified Rhizobium]KQS77642.1 DNA-3-methyladenine glycosidase [Rhizobium sp. Leaf384]KQS84581.1 DNA-3-methyladenine glycosidase [Rhizobium sp. Leaf383]
MRILSDHDVSLGLSALTERDPRLIPILAATGPVPLRRSEPGFSGLAAIIVSQMISKASAAAIWNRLVLRLGTVEAQAFLSLAEEECRAVGLSAAKIKALRAAASAVEAGSLDLDGLCSVDPQVAIATLGALPGIGRWTAEVYLVFCAGHCDIFPVGDVALQSAVADALCLDMRPSARVLEGLSLAWSPWRSVAARLFWAFYAQRMRRDAAPVLAGPDAAKPARNQLK